VRDFRPFYVAPGQILPSWDFCGTAALPLKPDIGWRGWHVRKVPKADSCTAASDISIRSPRRPAAGRLMGSPVTTRSAVAVASIQSTSRAGLQMPLSTCKPSLMIWTAAVPVTRFSVPLLTPNVVCGESPNTMGLMEGLPTSGTGS
jgi:hypothetical protein